VWSLILRKVLEHLGVIDHVKVIIFVRQAIEEVEGPNMGTTRVNVNVYPVGMKLGATACVEIF
jgi:hypothetical protein